MKFLIIVVYLFSIQSLYAIETIQKDSLDVKQVETVVDTTKADTPISNDTLGVIDTSIAKVKSEILPYKITKTNIYNLGANEDECDVVAICEDKEHFALRVKKRDTHAIHYPTFKKKFFNFVGKATISPDCKSVAYGAIGTKKSYLYVNNQLINKDFDPKIYPKYNNDGSKLLFFKENWNTLSSKPRRIIVVDSTEYKFDKLIGTKFLNWSPDKKHWAALVRKGRKNFLVLDGKKGPSYQGCYIGPIFSDDSKKIAYTAYRRDTCYLVIASEVNGNFGGEYIGKKSKEYYKYTKGFQAGSSYQELGGYRDIYGFMFFDSSYDFVMQTVMNYDHYVETVDTTYGPYDTTNSFEFNDENQFSFCAKKGKSIIIKTFDGIEKIIDSLITKKANRIIDLNYSDDNLHSSYVVVNHDGSENLYVDDSLIDSSNKYKFNAQFIPNSSEYLYFAREMYEVDGYTVPKSTFLISSKWDRLKYESMSYPLFSSDGSITVLLGYNFSDERKLNYADLIINGKVYQRYTDFMGFDKFDESDNLTLFMTEKKKRVYKLVISPNILNAEEL